MTRVSHPTCATPQAGGEWGHLVPQSTETQKLVFTFASPTSQVLQQLFEGDILTNIRVFVTEPFDGDADFELGTTGELGAFLPLTTSYLEFPDAYEVTALHVILATDFLIMTFFARGSTRGAATLLYDVVR